MNRRAAALVDKILRGAKPGEPAIEQPERFQLVVNMKTAKAIGVSLSPTTMLRADKVIE
jgi:putative ABC transport system substrate-binding protein